MKKVLVIVSGTLLLVGSLIGCSVVDRDVSDSENPDNFIPMEISQWQDEMQLELVELADEQETIRRIKRFHAIGMSYTKIAKVLNEEGITTKNGNQWFSQTVKNVVNK